MMIPEIALFIWDVEKKRKWTKKKKKKNSQKGYQNIIIYSTPNKLCEIFFYFAILMHENFKRKREECFIKFIFFIM